MGQFLRSCLHVFLTASGYAFIFVGGASVAWIYLPCLRALGRSRAQMAWAAQSAIRWGFTSLFDALRAGGRIDFDPRACRSASPTSPVVIVANHPTGLDVLAIMASFDRVCCLVKHRYYRSPFVGPMLRWARYIDGGSSEAPSVRMILHETLERLDAGYSVLLFPEDSRSPEGGMLPFRRLAFEVAARADKPVLPVCLRCEPLAVGKGIPWYRFPRQRVRYRVTPLPMHFPKTGRANVRAAMRNVQDALRASLAGQEPLSTTRRGSIREQA